MLASGDPLWDLGRVADARQLVGRMEPSPISRSTQAVSLLLLLRVRLLRGRLGLWSCPPSQSPALSRRGGGSTSAPCMEARGWAPRRQLCPPGILLLAVAFLLSCLLTCGQAKVYSRCELFRVLQDFGLEGYRGHSLADCEHPSSWLAMSPSIHPFLSSSLPPPSTLPPPPLLPQGVCPQELSQPQFSFVKQELCEITGREHPARSSIYSRQAPGSQIIMTPSCPPLLKSTE